MIRASEITPAIAASSATRASAPARADSQALWNSARALEAALLTEMLGHAGLKNALETGTGGDAFASLLVEAYAAKLASSGALGIAEKIYRQLAGAGNESAD